MTGGLSKKLHVYLSKSFTILWCMTIYPFIFPQEWAFIFLMYIFMQKLSPLIILLPSLGLSWLLLSSWRCKSHLHTVQRCNWFRSLSKQCCSPSRTNLVWVLWFLSLTHLQIISDTFIKFLKRTKLRWGIRGKLAFHSNIIIVLNGLDVGFFVFHTTKTLLNFL